MTVMEAIGIPCPRKKIPCIFPARAQKIPCSPAQGILPQDPRIQGLFDAHFGRKRPNSLLTPCSAGNFPCSRASPHLQEPRRLRQLDRHDPLARLPPLLDTLVVDLLGADGCGARAEQPPVAFESGA